MVNDQEVAETLHKYRDEEAYFLNFTPRIEVLVDKPYCQYLTSAINNVGAKWERMKATPDLANMLPNEKGLYMFVWKPEIAFHFEGEPTREHLLWVLYVGKAGNEDSSTATIRSRYSSEYSKYVGRSMNCLWERTDPKSRSDMLTRFLTLQPLEFWYLPMEDISDVSHLEKKLIRALRPPLNRQHGVALRVGKTNPVS